MRRTMQRRLIVLAAGTGVLGWAALFAMQGDAGDALKQIGISGEAARGHIFSSVVEGSLSSPSSRTLKQIPPAVRAGIVAGLGAFARTYLESDSFAAQYRELRDSRRPAPPEPPSTIEQDRQEYKQSLVEGLRRAEELLKSTPAEYREGIEQTIAFLREQLKAADDPDNPMFSSEMDEFKRQQAAEADLEYRERLARWEREYPEDPRAMIRLRLEQFLRESEGVDYTAKLKARSDGTLIFENPAYESKPASWKLCYRAGRETVEAAREFARAWLADLNTGR